MTESCSILIPSFWGVFSREININQLSRNFHIFSSIWKRSKTEILHLLIHSTCAYNSQGNVMLKSRFQNSEQVSRVGGRHSSTWSIIYCLPGYALVEAGMERQVPESSTRHSSVGDASTPGGNLPSPQHKVMPDLHLPLTDLSPQPPSLSIVGAGLQLLACSGLQLSKMMGWSWSSRDEIVWFRMSNTLSFSLTYDRMFLLHNNRICIRCFSRLPICTITEGLQSAQPSGPSLSYTDTLTVFLSFSHTHNLLFEHASL